MRRILILAALIITAVAAARYATADVWPRFRGPNGEGQGEAESVPSEFTPSDFAWQGVAWARA